MPRNGSGQYDLPYNWNNDKANNIKVLASRMQSQDQDIANALTGSLSKDGQTPLTGDLDFNSNKAVDLGNGTSAQDAVAVSQVQSGGLQYYGVTSTTALGVDGENYDLSLIPSVAVYPTFVRFSFVCHYTCIAAPDVRFDALAAKNLVKSNGASGYIALEAGDLIADKEYVGIYNEDISNSQIIIENPEILSGTTFNDLTVNDLIVEKTINGAVFSPKKPTIANNVSDANSDINCSAGASFDAINYVGWASTAKTKRLDANWVAGTNQGGLDTGSKANDTGYYWYSIYNPTTNAEDFIATATFGSPTLPSGYTRSCYVGPIRTDASGNIIGFLQSGNYISYNQRILELNITSLLASKTSFPVKIPNKSNIIGEFYCLVIDSTEVFVRMFGSNQSDVTPSLTNHDLISSSSSTRQGLIIPLCSNNAQIAYRCDTLTTVNNFIVSTLGFIDNDL
jgi:hypothetical protein